MSDVIVLQVPGIQGPPGPQGPAGGFAYNVKNYGAIGSGDDATAAFNATIAAIQAAPSSSKGPMYIPRGSYLLSDEIKIPDFISVIGEWGAFITQTVAKPAFRLQGGDNVVENIQFSGGTSSIAIFGPSYGNPLADTAVCYINNCAFYNPTGPAIFLDTNSFSNLQLVIRNSKAICKCLYFGGCYLVIDTLQGYFNVSGGTVNDTLGRPLSYINTCSNAFLRDLELIPAGVSAHPISFIQGTGLIDCLSVRFGGEDQCCVVRSRKAITYGTITLPSGVTERMALHIDAGCQLSCTAGKNWLEIEGTAGDFPASIVFDASTAVFTSSQYASTPSSWGVWIDSTVDLDVVSGYDSTNCQIVISGDPNGARTIRQSSNRATLSGTQVDEIFLDRTKHPANNALLPEKNYFNSGIIDTSGMSTAISTNLSAAAADTSSGWSIAGFTTTAANAIGSWYVSWGTGEAAGHYTFSVWLKTTKSCLLLFSFGSTVGSTYKTFAYAIGDDQYHRYSWPVYHTGTAKTLGIEVSRIPNSTTFYLGFLTMTRGDVADSWRYPGNAAPVQAMKQVFHDSAAPVSGTWVVGDIVWHSVPISGGNIGWVCTTGGTPGTWKAFGTIA